MYKQQVELPPRDSFMQAAEREMIAFELKEREFRKKLKAERAEELRLRFSSRSRYCRRHAAPGDRSRDQRCTPNRRVSAT
jgi:hypothetical protein